MNRYRRLRNHPHLRDMVKETQLSKEDLITPIFVVEGHDKKEASPSMPDFYRYSIDRLSEELDALIERGLKAILLFGVPSHKDSLGTSAYDDQGIVQEAIRYIKAYHEDFYIITDICLCQYTDHGHCGVLDDCGHIKNDETLPLLAKIAISHVKAGADMVAPSDMMDGRIGALRSALDQAGYDYTPIMSYSLKYCSSYYGPFRALADSSPKSGSRHSYQMDFHNKREALDVATYDIQTGADLIMVKPAMMYLDLVKTLKDAIDKPLVVYNVSGEYALIKNGITQGLVNEDIIYETMIGFKRAGADLIITYFTKEIVDKWL